MEKRTDAILVMTEKQWEARFKRNFHRWIKRKTAELVTYTVLPGITLLMIVHWFFIGY